MTAAERIKRTSIEAFVIEWDFRELLMKARRLGKRTIAHHRKELLHRYQLTEKDISDYEPTADSDMR